jgi:uncharacterized protein (TIGR03790 family)
LKLPLCFLLVCSLLPAQTAENVLIVVNQSSGLSRRIADYYIHKRLVPLANVCHLKVTTAEEIPWEVYEQQIERPIGRFLSAHRLQQKILYIVTTSELPLKISGSDKDVAAEHCSVDSELTLLYSKLRGVKFPKAGMVPNPFFRQTAEPFRRPRFSIYLVTRLAGYDFDDVKGMIDRSLEARNRGKFVIDLRSSENEDGNSWLRAAAARLPKDRVVLDESSQALYNQRDVIGYAGWGSNDKNRKQRWLGFQWLPGAIATEFVSENGRTFKRPPDSWNITTFADRAHWFAGSPQTLTADYIHEGASGCSGHVYEPYLLATPHPEYLLPAYYSGRNLAESYYLAIPGLSWQNIVIGDPLCQIGKPK